ncbi:DNA -binding domain-containing protein [Rhizobium rhizogenes]|uniref:DNA -binding domain-containing protein n=1 Tax=Rhizobium rhizogenes TaxID=359 RepID=UPI00403F0C2D
MGKAVIEPFDDIAPVGDKLTDYDRTHMKLYMRLLDAVADGADWREAVQVLFGIDPRLEAQRARRVHDSHLERARWMTKAGYKHLLRKPTSGSDGPLAGG